jgi:RNA 3'-terminal phosphate cyclase (ATP)
MMSAGRWAGFEMVEIDGSTGEGGGQVLRTALTLSILSAQPFSIHHIRSKRQKPGLMAQHLKAVDAAAAISRAHVEGAYLGSTTLEFHPGAIRSGRYQFDIGTAGATSLVLQTIAIPLSFASSASSVIITGGTHVAWSPCYHYLDLQWRYWMRNLGFDLQLTLDQAGFYPQGGGRISCVIRPAQPVRALHLHQRGALVKLSGMSAVAGLDDTIAQRQKRQALGSLGKRYPALLVKILEMPTRSKGTFLLILAEFESGRGCFCALGERGKPAERVADECVDAFEAFIDSGAAIDHFLADQLLLPLALAESPSQVFTSQVTHHLLTNAEVIREFLPAQIDVQGSIGEPGLVSVTPRTAYKSTTL